MTTSHPSVAVLWDMDGVLIDSEPLLYEAERLTFEEYGADFTLEDKKQFVGLGGHELMRLMAEFLEVDEDPEVLGEKKLVHVLNLLGAVEGYEPTTAMVKLLADQGVPMAVASGSSPTMIGIALTTVGLADYLPTRVAAVEVPRGKPAPDIFLEAAHRLGVDPANCVVVEDAVPGVKAAKEAGMRVIAIPYLTDPYDEQFDIADVVIPGGMKDANAEELVDWILTPQE